LYTYQNDVNRKALSFGIEHNELHLIRKVLRLTESSARWLMQQNPETRSALILCFNMIAY